MSVGFKKIILSAFSFFICSTVVAVPVNLYVDSAPNIYGSPDYPAWESTTYSSAADGSFTNMANSSNAANAGTTNFEMDDMVVYSFGDLGKRLHFLYWLPGETVAGLSGRFEVSLQYDWDGTTYDGYLGYYGTSWITPLNWQDYDSDGDGLSDGVMGSSGWAWWGAYGDNTQAALDADIASWNQYRGNMYFRARLDNEIYNLTAYHSVPEPSILFLFVMGLIVLSVTASHKSRKNRIRKL